jgi:hypothetical protein
MAIVDVVGRLGDLVRHGVAQASSNRNYGAVSSFARQLAGWRDQEAIILRADTVPGFRVSGAAGGAVAGIVRRLGPGRPVCGRR